MCNAIFLGIGCGLGALITVVGIIMGAKLVRGSEEAVLFRDTEPDRGTESGEVVDNDD